MHFGRVQEILVRSFDDQSVVLVAGELQEPLAEDVHTTKLGQEPVEGLALDDGDECAIEHKRVVTGRQPSPFRLERPKMPRITFIAGDADAGDDLWACGVEASASRPALAHGGLREPEDLFVRRGTLGIRILVRLLDDLKIAALLSWTVQHHAESTAVALKRDDWDALNLGADRDILSDPNFA